MTAAMEGGAGRQVRCPICMNITRWPTGDSVYLYSDAEQGYVRHSIDAFDPLRRADMRKRGYQPCQAGLDDDGAPDHYLPALYAEYDEALVIGFVGSTQSGKTHLLTAMVREILKRGGLTPYGLRAAPLDLRIHQQFIKTFLNRFERGEQLEGTRRNYFGGAFAESLLISGPTGRRPVVFFDVSGEDLEELDDTDRGGRFLVATKGVIFTYAPSDAQTRRDDQGLGDRDLDEAYRMSMNRLTAYAGHHDIPAAIAVTKADRLRFHAPADRWLRRPAETTLDAARIREESRDAYAYLRHVHAAAVLEPFAEFDRCTLHFVSATGKDVEYGARSYARGPKPIRVLEPLVSILAMAGVIPGTESEKVGLP